MDTTTQPPAAGPQVPAGLDPTAYLLTKAIAYQENGGQTPDYSAKGQSGEYGAYQWEEPTWDSMASTALGPNAPSLQDATPAQQNQVAYTQVAAWLKAGYTPAQVASMWNAGAGAPDAYKGNEGTNSSGVAYNTKSYVQGVQKYGQQLSQGIDPATGQQKPAYGYVAPPATTPPPAASAGTVAPVDASAGTNLGTSAPVTPANPAGAGGGIGSLTTLGQNLEKVPGEALGAAGSLLPILPDLINYVKGTDDKTALQQLGDAGMSALWFLPFGDLAEGAAAGAKALGVGAEAAKTAGVVATGVGTGYASDVSNNLAKGDTGANILTPGLGTLVGGGLAGAGIAAGGLYNKFLGQQSAVDSVAKAYEDAAGATKSGIRAGSATVAKGLDPNPEFLANAGILPETAEVNGRRVFTTGADSASQQALTDRIGALSDLRDQAVSQSGATVNFNDLKTQMLDQANKQFSGTAMTSAQSQIENEMTALAADPKYQIAADGTMSAADATKMKGYLQGMGKYDAATPALNAQVYKAMAGTTKTAVEDAATTAGTPSIEALNKMIQQHYDAQDFLTRINGQTIKGGRLGTYVKEGIGAAVGGAAGTVFGGGPVGTAVGTLAGAAGGKLVSDWMQKFATGGPLTAAVMGRMATEEPQIVQEFAKYIEAGGGKAAKEVAPLVKAAQKGGAQRVTDLLKKSPGSQVFRGMSRPSYAFGARP